MNVDQVAILEQDQLENNKRHKQKKSLSTTKDTVRFCSLKLVRRVKEA